MSGILSLTILLLALGTLFLLLPQSDGLPAEATNAIETAISWLSGWDYIFPVQTLLTVFGIALGFHLVLFTWRFFKWILHMISRTS